MRGRGECCLGAVCESAARQGTGRSPLCPSQALGRTIRRRCVRLNHANCRALDLGLARLVRAQHRRCGDSTAIGQTWLRRSAAPLRQPHAALPQALTSTRVSVHITPVAAIDSPRQRREPGGVRRRGIAFVGVCLTASSPLGSFVPPRLLVVQYVVNVSA